MFLTHSSSEYSFWIIGSKKLQSKQVTVHNWFIEPWKASGISFLINLNVFILRIARSTCIRTDAIDWLSFTSAFVSWYLPDRNAGLFNSTFKALRSSAIVNPLSSIHESPSSQNRRSNIPLLATISSSDMEPSKLTGENYSSRRRDAHQSLICDVVFIKWIQTRLGF